MTKLLFIILRGVKLFFNYFKSNLISIIALSALFLILHTVFGLGSGMADFAKKAADFDVIRAYTDTKNIKDTESVLKAIEGVVSVEYLSSANAKNYITLNAPGLNGMDKLADDLFPAFFIVHVDENHRDIASLDALSARIDALEAISHSSYGKDWAQNLTEGKNAVLSLLAIISVLFSVIGAVIIYQTVSVTLFRYRKEVRIYNISGGTAFFIVTPFVVTACITGLICSLFSLLLYLIFRVSLLSSIESVLGLNLAVGSAYVWVFILACVLISLIAGAVSAFMFLRNNQGSEG